MSRNSLLPKKLFRQRYNVHVRRDPQPDPARHRRHAVYASEATGLLLIAFVLLVLTLIRYWRVIHWSWR
jgi:hypothetical protein